MIMLCYSILPNAFLKYKMDLLVEKTSPLFKAKRETLEFFITW